MLDRILGISGRGASGPVPWDAWFVPVGKSTSGVSLNEDTALSFSAVFGAVKVISETLALLPWREYERRGAGKQIRAGSTVDMLLHERPNDEMTAFPFREYLSASALLHGNGYAEIERNGAREPVALWPLHPESVTPMRDRSTGALFYRVRDQNGGHDDILAAEMFHLRGPTRDGIVGRSVISLARESWSLGIAAEQFAGAFFGNGAVPSLFLEQGDASPKLSPEGATNMIESIERRHQGVRRAGRIALLEKGYTIKSIGIPQKDAQFLETRKFSVTDVARWFRVPPHKIGDLEKATFSNIESQERSFVNDAIMPWAVRLEQEADFKLIDAEGAYSKLNVQGLLRGDSKDRGEFYKTMRDLGAFSINEIRELEDRNPIPGGDLRLVPLNMVSVERAGKAGGTDDASAVRGVLLEAHERMMTKESRALDRAREKSQDLGAWATDFYAHHGQQLRDALMPGANAVGSICGLDAGVIGGVVDSHARLYCEAAFAAVAANSEKWAPGPRAAITETDRLLGRLMGAAHAQ